MLRRLQLMSVVVAVLAGCAPPAPPSAPPPSIEAIGNAIATASTARCIDCHAAQGAVRTVLAPPPRVPLQTAAAFHAGAELATFLRGHRAGNDAAVLATMMRALAPAPTFVAAQLGSGEVERGERLWRESGCAACHPQDGVAGIAVRTDHAQLAAFLQTPSVRRPDLAHDFALDRGDAMAIAAWLLRSQRVGDGSDAAPPGLVCECFELQIERPDLPDLEHLEPKRKVVVSTIDTAARTRGDHFALRFTGQLLVPTSGDWTFTLGCDDCAWLWIDGQLSIRNAALAPHRQKDATLRLDAGAHAIVVVYTEAAGQETLELLWRGPDREREPVPTQALATRTVTFAAPSPAADDAPQDREAAIAAGRLPWARHRCAHCHDLPGAPDVQAPARPWASLGDGACPEDRRAEGVAQLLRAAIVPLRPAIELEAALQQNRCRACHARDGRGGLAPAVRTALAVTEDLGDEGRLPPDLTHIGAHLRRDWLERVVRGAARARPYVRVRMPVQPPAVAARFARLFAVVDGAHADAETSVSFDAAKVERGRELVGSRGKNCVTCHRFGDRAAAGPQGMDLALQHERLLPAHFRDWLLRPLSLRPGTRMPALWVRGDDQDRADVDAVVAWAALGRAAPVPTGLRSQSGGLVLDPIERPLLHGAFLRGLSARCLCVGTPLQANYAYDLEHARLAWLWRGAFVDAAGTWEGRAGALLSPLGKDHVVLDDLAIVDLDAAAASSPSPTRVVGQQRTQDGYPVFVLQQGGAIVEDEPRPRLEATGVQFERSLRCVQGRVRIDFAPRSGAAAVEVGDGSAGPTELRAGERVTVRYRW